MRPSTQSRRRLGDARISSRPEGMRHQDIWKPASRPARAPAYSGTVSSLRGAARSGDLVRSRGTDRDAYLHTATSVREAAFSERTCRSRLAADALVSHVHLSTPKAACKYEPSLQASPKS